MTVQEIIDICLSYHGAYIDYPFGEIPICIKVCNHIFAQVYPKASDCKITLKCDAMYGDFYRTKYKNTVVRGYHCTPIQQPYWNTIYLNGIVDDNELKQMIEHAYVVVVNKLTKKEKLELKHS
ncbi:MmcQ/YjbR family DNA-binding protein [Paludicola sp. MB14-C6]|uniref:MmcQ/YjbR family DNA-binding protein n=1 Tax=Paludihabitans sp. MB14-C6 TaxID=3070656 RepID=UPI0027DB4AB4|nr:MmcQ/YjbR family DNA-binding protein [Paludicola sp. MB14-C6]WMJ22368.1 MmcQ/YjbR family DNA-binding protein [Paludicola sp. MB14-C6]